MSLFALPVLSCALMSQILRDSPLPGFPAYTELCSVGDFVPSPAPHSPHLLGQPKLSHPLTHRGGSVPSALACPANTIYQSCMTPCPASCANLAAPGDCKGPCVEGCATLPGYVYSDTQSLPLALCGCTNNGIYYQVRGQWEAWEAEVWRESRRKKTSHSPGPSLLSSGETAL